MSEEDAAPAQERSDETSSPAPRKPVRRGRKPREDATPSGEASPEQRSGRDDSEASVARETPAPRDQEENRRNEAPQDSDRRGGGDQGGNQGGNFGGGDRRNFQRPGGKKKKKNRKGRGERGERGGPGGGVRRSGLYVHAAGFPVEFDFQVELGQLPTDEMIRDVDALRESFAAQFDAGVDAVDFNALYELDLKSLWARAEEMGLEFDSSPNRAGLLDALLNHFQEARIPIRLNGVLEVFDDGYGLLVYACDSYRVRPLSAFVPEDVIDHYGLQRGHEMEVLVQAPREGETCPLALVVSKVMGGDPAGVEKIVPFTERVPYYPLERILLEADPDEAENNLSMRVVDLISPIGFGQRGLIVAPPRTGKTVLLQGIAHSVQINYPEAHLIVLLIDERPEEVTDFRRRVKGEVIASTFDESAESHVHAAEIVIEKARRLVEVGRDVVILLDSITRLARAYNTMMPNSGKILSGGVEANALQKPKRFFGSARNIEEGGSLTIMGTALVDTGSKMDEVIFEEFKGTGNMELHLDRALVDKRIFPALSMDRSGTRKEELLYHPDEMQKVYSLRRATKGVPPVEAMEMLIQRIKKTRTNAEFLMTLSR